MRLHSRTGIEGRLTRGVYALERALLLLDSEELAYEREQFSHYIPDESKVTVLSVGELRQKDKHRRERQALQETREFQDFEESE